MWVLVCDNKGAIRDKQATRKTKRIPTRDQSRPGHTQNPCNTYMWHLNGLLFSIPRDQYVSLFIHFFFSTCHLSSHSSAGLQTLMVSWPIECTSSSRCCTRPDCGPSGVLLFPALLLIASLRFEASSVVRVRCAKPRSHRACCSWAWVK